MPTIDDLVAQAVPIQDASVALDAIAHMYVPRVRIDVSQRPDLADLPRVYRMEGSGDYTYTWNYYDEFSADALFILLVRMERPVKAVFALLFPVSSSIEFLTTLAEAGRLGLVTGVLEEFSLLSIGADTSINLVPGSLQEGFSLSFDELSSHHMLVHLQDWCKRYPLADRDARREKRASNRRLRWWWPFGGSG